MKGCLTWAGIGFGLSLGGGIVYVLVTNQTAFIVFLAVGMFVLGALLMAAVLLFFNRQWTQAAFGGQAPKSTYNVRLPSYPQYGPPPVQSPGYLPGPESFGGIVIEQPQGAGALTDDSPMA